MGLGCSTGGLREAFCRDDNALVDQLLIAKQLRDCRKVIDNGFPYARGQILGLDGDTVKALVRHAHLYIHVNLVARECYVVLGFDRSHLAVAVGHPSLEFFAGVGGLVAHGVSSAFCQQRLSVSGEGVGGSMVEFSRLRIT